MEVGREFLYPAKLFSASAGKEKKKLQLNKTDFTINRPLLEDLANEVCNSGRKKMILEGCLSCKKKWWENKLVNMCVKNIHANCIK